MGTDHSRRNGISGGSDERCYVLHDFLYSASAVVDSTGTVLERVDYEPYGAPTIWSGDYTDTRAETAVHNHFLFTGQRYDPETGLYHYKARAYHPSLGRFLQRDPLNYKDGNCLQEYVGSSPMGGFDSLGMYTEETRLKCLSMQRAELEECDAIYGSSPKSVPQFTLEAGAGRRSCDRWPRCSAPRFGSRNCDG